MHYTTDTLKAISERILSICHSLEFDLFMTGERRVRLEAELSKLLKDRDQFVAMK